MNDQAGQTELPLFVGSTAITDNALITGPHRGVRVVDRFDRYDFEPRLGVPGRSRFRQELLRRRTTVIRVVFQLLVEGGMLPRLRGLPGHPAFVAHQLRFG